MVITVDPDQMGDVPCIRGTRTPGATVLGRAADGRTEDEILDADPHLEREDIRKAIPSEERSL